MGLTICGFQGGVIVYDPGSSEIHHVNASAAAILRRAAMARSVAASNLWSRIDRLNIPRTEIETALSRLAEPAPAELGEASIVTFPLDGLQRASPILVFQDDAAVFGPLEVAAG